MVVVGQRDAPAALPTGKSRYPLYRRLFYTEYFDFILLYQLTNSAVSRTIYRQYVSSVLDGLFI